MYKSFLTSVVIALLLLSAVSSGCTGSFKEMGESFDPTNPPENEQVKAVFNTYVDYFNAGDAQGLSGLLSENARLEHPPGTIEEKLEYCRTQNIKLNEITVNAVSFVTPQEKCEVTFSVQWLVGNGAVTSDNYLWALKYEDGSWRLPDIIKP